MKTITDGSAVFVVRDKRMQSMIDMFYPVGSVYVSADKTKTKAGLPNITGTVKTQTRSDDKDYGASGALSSGSANGDYIISSSLNTSTRQQIKFDASKSNAIYGASNTVQPPAYTVRAWVRTA